MIHSPRRVGEAPAVARPLYPCTAINRPLLVVAFHAIQPRVHQQHALPHACSLCRGEAFHCKIHQSDFVRWSCRNSKQKVIIDLSHLKRLVTHQRTTQNRFIRNFDFDYPQTNSHFTVTSVSGHLLAHDFPDAYRQWHSCDPISLFDAPIHTIVPTENKTIERNLMNEARSAHTLMIWTDCDREGENIGWEIVTVCRKAKPNILVRRARFSAIIPQFVLIYPCYVEPGY